MLKIVGAVFDVKAKAWTFEAKAKDKAIKIILCLAWWRHNKKLVIRSI